MTRKHMFLTLTAFSVAAAALFSAQQGAAQSARNCAPRDVVVERLAEHYGETRQSFGLGGNNTVIEVFASTETGTWTITVTQANGVTCLVASGQSYEAVTEEAAKAGKKV